MARYDDQRYENDDEQEWRGRSGAQQRGSGRDEDDMDDDEVRGRYRQTSGYVGGFGSQAGYMTDDDREHDDYYRWREAQVSSFDEDYRAFQEQRAKNFHSDFEEFRKSRARGQQARGQSSLGQKGAQQQGGRKQGAQRGRKKAAKKSSEAKSSRH